tara:strand:- start:2049 stop:3365 length:1317 start_codon:yes stop_codon:yes gene_type:complete
MKILLVDLYPDRDFRLIKDTNGSYGTGNDFGNSILCKVFKRLSKKNLFWPTTTTAYTMSVLKEVGHDVEYSNGLIQGFEVYIFISSIISYELEIESIKNVRKFSSKILAIGPFAANNPKKYIENGCTVIFNESEFYFKENNIDNINFENPELLVSNNLDSDVDNLPLPAWDYFLKKNMLTYGLLTTKIMIPILATRGCPYSCSHYCVYPLSQGKKLRARSPKNIVDEIEYWNTNFNVKNFVFRDPVFSINRKHTIELCNLIIEKKLDLKFVVETHLNNLDDEIIPLLKKSGMNMVKVGIESADEEVLNSSKRKSITLDLQKERIRKLEKMRIKVVAMYIIGMIGDNVKKANVTINYAKELNTYLSQCSIFTPYPGTPVYREFSDRINVDSFEKFNQYNLVFDHPSYDNKTARLTLDKFYNNYYLRLSWLQKFVRQIFF